MRQLLQKLLAWQLRRLLARNKGLTTVAVAGSVGKTGTKLAIATVLSQEKRVIYQEGNYNVALTIPLVYFGQKLPNSLINIFAWIQILIKNETTIKKAYPYDVAVIEMGIDHPGEMKQLCGVVTPDISVVTAISFEHMEYFESLDQVAAEELSITSYSKTAFVCQDSISSSYLKGIQATTYGVRGGDVRVEPKNYAQGTGYKVSVVLPGGSFEATAGLVGEHNLTAAAAAAAVGNHLGLDTKAISDGFAQLKPFLGRMNILKGIKDTVIIDDTYNASPEATKKALDSLYSFDAMHRIAVLGSMNELGSFSDSSHTEVGAYCRADKLDYVVTIGSVAAKILAPIAEQNGCKVKSFTSPYEAGKFVSSLAGPDTVILFKGSQNGVFAEEAIKPLLANEADKALLVRQSQFWLKKKRSAFSVQEQDQ